MDNQLEDLILLGEEIFEQNLDDQDDQVVKWKNDVWHFIKFRFGKNSKEFRGIRNSNLRQRLLMLKSLIDNTKVTSQKPVVYNIQGNNTRININSTDSSNNIVNTSSENLFIELKKVLNESVNDTHQREEIINAVNELEINQNTSRFLEKYQKFIELAKTHIEIITPFIPALTQMLS